MSKPRKAASRTGTFSRQKNAKKEEGVILVNDVEPKKGGLFRAKKKDSSADAKELLKKAKVLRDQHRRRSNERMGLTSTNSTDNYDALRGKTPRTPRTPSSPMNGSFQRKLPFDLPPTPDSRSPHVEPSSLRIGKSKSKETLMKSLEKKAAVSANGKRNRLPAHFAKAHPARDYGRQKHKKPPVSPDPSTIKLVTPEALKSNPRLLSDREREKKSDPAGSVNPNGGYKIVSPQKVIGSLDGTQVIKSYRPPNKKPSAHNKPRSKGKTMEENTQNSSPLFPNKASARNDKLRPFAPLAALSDTPTKQVAHQEVDSVKRRSKQLNLQPGTKTPEDLCVQIDEVLKIGTVLERYGTNPGKQSAFSWLAEHRDQQNQEAMARKLNEAIGDVIIDRRLCLDVICVLQQHSVLSDREARRLWTLLNKEQEVTVGLLAMQLRDVGKCYKKTAKSHQ